MKKTVIALAFSALTLSQVTQAAPQENTFYAGARVGSASFHDGLTQFKQNEMHDLLGQSTNGYMRTFVTHGVYGGYQFVNNDYFGLAAEVGYDDFGRAKYRQNGTTKLKHTNHGASVSLKASYPLFEGFDAYTRVGAALVRSDYKNYNRADVHEHSLKVSPLYAAGFEYALMPELALRVEYQWLNKVGKLKDANGNRVDYTPSIGSITAGLSYRFGQGEQAAPAPVVEVNRTFSLNSDVTFAFGKANLRPEARSTLDGIYGEISQVNDAKVNVAGYTDRIGSATSNLKLSQRRADTVANYFVAKGLASEAISAVGYGEANPVTGATCDNVKGRKVLISCLAPDRRVEVSVTGNK